MKKITAKKLVPKIKDLYDLRTRAKTDERYIRLAIAGSSNTGGPSAADRSAPTPAEFEAALRWLDGYANEMGSERGIVGEVNFVRDCI